MIMLEGAFGLNQIASLIGAHSVAPSLSSTSTVAAASELIGIAHPKAGTARPFANLVGLLGVFEGHQHPMNMAQSHVQEHIDLIARHEQEFLEKRTRSERLGDRIAAFAGSMGFVSIHLLTFLGWIVVNTWNVPGIPHFDTSPYSLLATLVAVEAILLASFILMRQARMGRRADERDHLMLQILLLTEKEITAVLGMDRQIAKQMGLNKVANATEIRELSQHTSIEDVAQTIRETMPESGE